MRRALRLPTPLAAVLALCLVPSACGKRGDPLPPLRKTPQPVSGLHLAQRGDTLEITFTTPRATTDGVPLPVFEVELLRADVEGDFAKLAKKTTRRVAPGESLVETAPLPPAGSTVRVAARAVSKGHPSTLTAIVTLQIGAAPEPPSALTAVLVAQGVHLEWTPPTVMPTPRPTPPPTPAPGLPQRPGSVAPSPGAPPPPGASPAEPPPNAPPGAASEAAEEQAPSPGPSPELTPEPTPEPTSAPTPEAGAAPAPSPAPASSPTPTPVPTPPPTPPPPTTGFFVYRRSPDSTYSRPLQTVPLQSPTLDDPARPGERWCYVVKTVASTDPLVESAPTTEACVDVRDVAAPATPGGVALLPRNGALEISWSPAAETDLAVYRVYRAPRGGKPERLAEVPAGTTSYRDTTAQPGAVYVYTVTAVDTAGNESPPSPGATGSRE